MNNISIAERKGIAKEEIDNLKDDDPVWEIVGHYLGNLCANIALLASPEVIILGGGIMQRKTIYGYLIKSFEKCINGYLQHSKLKSSFW